MTAPKRDANDVVPHRVELAGQTVAGGIGSAYGAAKLRDAYKAEHPEKFRNAIRRSAVRASRAGVPHEKIVSAAKLAHSGKPPFAALVTLTAAGGTAAAAHHYQQINNWSKKRQSQLAGLAKSEPRRAPSAKIRLRATPAPKHGVKPYLGKHRTLTPIDNVKATAMLHSKHLAGALEGITDLFKAVCYRCAEMVPGEARYAHHATFGRVQILGHHGGGQVHILDRSDQGRVVHQDTLRINRKKGSTMAKSAFGAELEKAHVLRDIAAVGGAAGAGALLAKPKLAADVVKATQTRVIKPFARAYRNPAGEARPMPGPGPVAKSAFGVPLLEVVSKDDGNAGSLGSEETKQTYAHHRGEHAGAKSRSCTMCNDPRYAARSAIKAATAMKKDYGPGELLKASAFGSEGDKRNTKYYLAGAAGGAAGSQVGQRLGARIGGSTRGQVRQASGTDLAGSIKRGVEGAGKALAGPKHAAKPPSMLGAQLGMHRSITSGALKDVKAVKGGKAMLRGGAAGATVGIAGAAGAYHAHRKHAGLAKSAFLEKADRKKPSAGRVAAGTAFTGLHGAVAGKKGKKVKATGAELGHSLTGGVLGGIPGAVLRKPVLATAGAYGGGYGGAAHAVYTNQAKGRYKRES